jgi:hypothetical protein
VLLTFAFEAVRNTAERSRQVQDFLETPNYRHPDAA